MRTLSVGQLRVQSVRYGDGREAYTIFDSVRGVHGGADRYLADYASAGTDRTYAYLLVDHLRWLEYEGLSVGVYRRGEACGLHRGAWD